MSEKEDFQAAINLWTMGLGDSNKRLAGEDPMPPKTEKAKRSSWTVHRMPRTHEDFYLGMEITKEEKDILELGHIPEVMEDHWFMYCEDNVIRYYRSWTGFCIFKAKIEREGDHFIVGKARVNRSKKQYTCDDIEYDRSLLAQLIAWEVGREC